MCQNIKDARAVTTEEDLTTYFSNLQTSGVQTIPPGNILNNDKTNMVDDLKSKKMIFKCSAKRSERVMNFTTIDNTFYFHKNKHKFSNAKHSCEKKKIKRFKYYTLCFTKIMGNYSTT